MWCHSIVWRTFGDKQTSKYHKIRVPHSFYTAPDGLQADDTSTHRARAPLVALTRTKVVFVPSAFDNLLHHLVDTCKNCNSAVNRSCKTQLFLNFELRQGCCGAAICSMSHSPNMHVGWEPYFLLAAIKTEGIALGLITSFEATRSHESHETCHSAIFIVLVNSHQRWKQTRNRVCFHLWCELTMALWCHSIVWSLFSWNKL